MAIGSCFDAILKARISESILGRKYEDVFDQLFTSQVDEKLRSKVLPYGLHCWTEYRESGAFSDLLLELSIAAAEPRMELEIRESVMLDNLPVPLLGRPDLYFICPGGEQVVYDFKVNGYLGSSALSPKPGYIVSRVRNKDNDSWIRKPYKNCLIKEVIPGIKTNVNMLPRFGSSHQDRLIQLVMYAWILGEGIGTETVFGIEQLTGSGPYGDIRVSSFRFQVERSVQIQLRDLIREIWTGNINLSEEMKSALQDPVFRLMI